MPLLWILSLISCLGSAGIAKEYNWNNFETEYLNCGSDSIMIRSEYKESIDSCLTSFTRHEMNGINKPEGVGRTIVKRGDITRIGIEKLDSLYQFEICANTAGIVVYSKLLNGGVDHPETLNQVHKTTLKYKCNKIAFLEPCLDCGVLTIKLNLEN